MVLKGFLLTFILAFSFAGTSQTEGPEDGCLVVVPKQLIKNNDDRITVEMDCPVSQFSFKVFNRWGQLLYETSTFSTPLDFDIHARMKGKRKKLGPEKFLSGGTYHWQLEYQEVDSVNTRKASGQLNIL